MLKYAWLTVIAGMALGAASIVLGARALRADTAPSVAVNPATVTGLYYRPTPITITINASGLSGAGLTPVGGYQYGLQWDPAVLQWLSGPDVGPGTPTPQPVLPGSSEMVSTWTTPTATPSGFVPPDTLTPTNTPGAGTPTSSPTLTPTPSGYIQVACATFPGAPTPVASGVLGTFTFQPLATAQASSALNLLKVILVNSAGELVTPGPAVSSGVVNLLACLSVYNPPQTNTDGNNAAMNRAGYDNILDACDDNISGDGYTNEQHTALGKDPARYCSIMRADVNGDGAVGTPDLARVGKNFGQVFTHDYYPPGGVDTGIQRLDQNGDNGIGTPDMAFVGRYFGQGVATCP
jgi:hypothetical protein